MPMPIKRKNQNQFGIPSIPIRFDTKTAAFHGPPMGKASYLVAEKQESLYVTGLTGGGVTRYLKNAHSPDWKTPGFSRENNSRDKLHTAWGEVKEKNRAKTKP